MHNTLHTWVNTNKILQFSSKHPSFPLSSSSTFTLSLYCPWLSCLTDANQQFPTDFCGSHMMCLNQWLKGNLFKRDSDIKRLFTVHHQQMTFSLEGFKTFLGSPEKIHKIELLFWSSTHRSRGSLLLLKETDEEEHFVVSYLITDALTPHVFCCSHGRGEHKQPSFIGTSDKLICY